MAQQVVLVGASGLIGGHLLTELIESDKVTEILLLLRSPLDVSNKKVRQLLVNFDEIGDIASEIKGDIVYTCLGTTKSATPDSGMYRKVDLEYPLSVAKIASENGVKQFHIVSSMGANPESNYPYLKLKGELEESLKLVSFDSLHIYRPSLLTGDRKEYRLAEKIATPLLKLIEPILIGFLRNYRSIKATTVAQFMLHQSLKGLKGTQIYTSTQIQKLA